MGKKRRNREMKRKAASEKATPARARSGSGRMLALALLGIGGGLFVYALTTGSSSDRSIEPATAPAPAAAASSPRQFRYYEDPKDAHPLPETLAPSRFRNPGIAASYRIAQEIPEVLAQQPCLCGCDNPSDDHRSLLDCFTDEHAATCMVCMKEAVFAKQQTDDGKSGEWIRNAILRHEFSDVAIGN